MSSSGTGVDMSRQEMTDFINKLMAESAKVQAAFSNVIRGIAATVQGVVQGAPDGTVWIVADPHKVGTAHISFDPKQVVLCKYADHRGWSGLNEQMVAGGGPNLTSAVVMAFEDTSQLGLFVIE